MPESFPFTIPQTHAPRTTCETPVPTDQHVASTSLTPVHIPDTDGGSCSPEALKQHAKLLSAMKTWLPHCLTQDPRGEKKLKSADTKTGERDRKQVVGILHGRVCARTTS